MPVYDYTCAACGRRFEVLHGVHAEGPTACPLCGKGPVRKAITAAAVHYRGSGWAKKERHAAASGSKRGSGETAAAEAGGANEGGSSSKDDGGSTAKAEAGSGDASTPSGSGGSKKGSKKTEARPATAGD
jgi:putative FmdB family regulatory protein